jgi:hypothetical protein
VDEALSRRARPLPSRASSRPPAPLPADVYAAKGSGGPLATAPAKGAGELTARGAGGSMDPPDAVPRPAEAAAAAAAAVAAECNAAWPLALTPPRGGERAGGRLGGGVGMALAKPSGERQGLPPPRIWA